MAIRPTNAYTSLDTSNAYGSGSRQDVVASAATKAPQFPFFARKLWTTEDGAPRPTTLAIADGSRHGYTFQAKDGFTQGNAASSVGDCLTQGMAIDDAFHKLEAEGLIHLVQIWAYHDDVVLMVPTDAWLQTYKIFEQSFSDRALHFAAHKNTTMVPMPFDADQ